MLKSSKFETRCDLVDKKFFTVFNVPSIYKISIHFKSIHNDLAK